MDDPSSMKFREIAKRSDARKRFQTKDINVGREISLIYCASGGIGGKNFEVPRGKAGLTGMQQNLWGIWRKKMGLRKQKVDMS